MQLANVEAVGGSMGETDRRHPETANLQTGDVQTGVSLALIMWVPPGFLYVGWRPTAGRCCTPFAKDGK